MYDSHIDIDPDGDTLIILKHPRIHVSTQIIQGVALEVDQCRFDTTKTTVKLEGLSNRVM